MICIDIDKNLISGATANHAQEYVVRNFGTKHENLRNLYYT